jgi:hypothetical protein
LIWSIGYLNRLWPFIFIGWGGLAPQGNPFTNLNLSGLLFSVRTGGHRSDRWGAPVRPVHSTCISCISHISLIRTPIWTFYIWILIYLTRPIQWWSPNCISWSLTTPVWPVGPTGLTDHTQDVPILCANSMYVSWLIICLLLWLIIGVRVRGRTADGYGRKLIDQAFPFQDIHMRKTVSDGDHGVRHDVPVVHACIAALINQIVTQKSIIHPRARSSQLYIFNPWKVFFYLKIYHFMFSATPSMWLFVTRHVFYYCVICNFSSFDHRL